MLNEEQKKRAERLREKVGAINGTILEAEDTLADFAFLEVKVPIGDNPEAEKFLAWDQRGKRIVLIQANSQKPLAGASLPDRISLIALVPKLIEAALSEMETGLADVEPAKGESDA